MIGFYDYTVILTYLSLASSCTGIMLSLNEDCKPSIGILCLLLCGLLDAFDGRIARMKKNRTDSEKYFGVQIDSLSDLVAFGVLPSAIGCSLLRRSEIMASFRVASPTASAVVVFFLYAIMVLYSLAALIRLAYFNVLEQEKVIGTRENTKGFIGVPVTTSALIFPIVMLIKHFWVSDVFFLYIGVMLLLGISFLLKIKIKKPTFKTLMLMILIGAVEYGIILAYLLIKKKCV